MLQHHGTTGRLPEIVVLDGESYRMKEAKARQDERRQKRKRTQGTLVKTATGPAPVTEE